MAEPKNHTLVLLREIRAAITALDKDLNRKIDALDDKTDSLDRKIDRNHDDLKKRIDALRQAAFGESVLG
jgi:hypothetical protein